MLKISISEFRKKLSYYLKLSSKETINITKNGIVIATLCGADNDYYHNVIELFGCLDAEDSERNYDDLIGEEIIKKCGLSKDK